MKETIDTIIFDLGGVLVDWKPEYVYRKVFHGNEEKVQWFLNTVCTPAWNIEQDAGRTIAEAVKLKIDEFPQYKNWIELFYKDWEHMFSGPIIENLNLLKKLKAAKHYKIFALTNWSAEKWDKAIELFPFFNDFDGVVVSGQEKTRKPFPTIYKTLLNRYQINPKRAIFIDDNYENIVAANELNIHGIHYKNHSQLIKDLETFKLKF